MLFQPKDRLDDEVYPTHDGLAIPYGSLPCGRDGSPNRRECLPIRLDGVPPNPQVHPSVRKYVRVRVRVHVHGMGCDRSGLHCNRDALRRSTQAPNHGDRTHGDFRNRTRGGPCHALCAMCRS